MKTSHIINRVNGLLIPFLMLASILTSCTETVEFEFDTVDPELVVEAFVPESQYAEVILSKTVNINNQNTHNVVTNASVVLEDGFGTSETLYEVAPGRYRSSKIKGVPGSNYTLSVATDENISEIKSEDKMPKPVFINRLRVRKSILPEIEQIQMPEWEVIVEYTDPGNETNYYRFVEYVNGKVIASYVENDKFNNGKDNKSFLTCVDRKLTKGDTLTVEMQSISKAVYDYFYGFSTMNNIIQGTTNTNPVSNISGAKLGYFSAHTVHRRSVVIE
ncbi:MAG: DUF4249 domain-containing protein [Paludibacter sp.]|nr:DUF4249 domain-containing protein [Paludibacter sp.]MDD4198329.1 DUF4249 domain-containing protein [Paludibacter sp.]MDD4428070.1 DUF4249 domain-containing protein [Paludibacter sp.]